MTKYFVQLLLSVIVGVGAALSFSPNGKAELHEAWQDAKISLDEMANGVGNVGDLAARISTAISVKANVKSDENAEVKLNGNLNAKVSNGNPLVENLLPGFLLKGSATDEARTNVAGDVQDLSAELKNKTTSTLNLDFDTGE